MSTPKRNADEGKIAASNRTFFTTTNTWERRQLFRAERLARLLIDTMFRYRDSGKFRLHEFVVMPEHLHVLLTVDEETSVEHAMQLIKGGFSFRVKHELGAATVIWQKGFSDRRIRNSGEYRTAVEYIRMNPVRAHLCETAGEYPYSSATTEFALDPCPAAKAAVLVTP